MRSTIWILILLGMAAPTHSETWRIRSDGLGDAPTIQAGIDSAAVGDTVLVAAGTFAGAGNRDLDFGGKDLTVKSEGGASTTTIDCGGSPAEPHRAFDLHGGETSSARIEGFTIARGWASGGDPDGHGGAIRCTGASATITHCVFSGNHCDQSGGAISIMNGVDLTIIDSELVGNESASSGGALSCAGSSVTLEGCIIAGNRFGGIFCDNSTMEIRRTTVAANDHETTGGGLFGLAGVDVTFVESILWGNCCPFLNSSDAFIQISGTLAFLCSDADPSRIFTAGTATATYDLDTITAVPIFCGASDCAEAPSASGDYSLDAASPCLAANSPCGSRMGARDIGCTINSIREASWGRMKSAYRTH